MRDRRGQYPRSGLWSRDRQAYQHLAWLAGSRKGWLAQPGQTYHYRGFPVVTAAKPKPPYGWAAERYNPDRTVTHNTSLVLMAWRGGVLIGSMSRWLCGATTTEPEFGYEVPTRACLMCWARANGPPVVITNSVVFMEVTDEHGGA